MRRVAAAIAGRGKRPRLDERVWCRGVQWVRNRRAGNAIMRALSQALNGWRVRLVIVVCVASVATLALPWRFEAIPSGNANLAGEGGHWIVAAIFGRGVQVHELGGVPIMRIEANPSKTGHLASYVLPPLPRADGIRVRIEARADGIVHGQERWQYADIALWSFDRSGKSLWYWPKRIHTIDGSHDWTWFDAEIPIAGEVDRMVLVVRNAATDGAVSLRGLSVDPVQWRAGFAWARYVLIATWALLIGYLAACLVRWRGIAVGKAMLFGAGIVALAGIVTPQPYFSQATKPLEDLLHSLDHQVSSDIARPRGPEAAPAPTRPDQRIDQQSRSPAAEAPRFLLDAPPRMPSDLTDRSAISFKQLGHFLCFLALSFAAWLAFPHTPIRVLLAYLVLTLLASEVLQLFVITRSSSWDDIGVDILGVLSGLVTAGLVRLVLLRSGRFTLLSRAAAP